MSADSHAIDSGSASNKVSNQNLSSHSVAHSAIAKTMTSETVRDFNIVLTCLLILKLILQLLMSIQT